MMFISICLPLSDIIGSCKALTAKLAAFLYVQDFWPQDSTSAWANHGKAPGFSLIWPAFHKVKWLWLCPCFWGVGSSWAQVAVLNKQDFRSWLCVSEKPYLSRLGCFLVWCATQKWGSSHFIFHYYKMCLLLACITCSVGYCHHSRLSIKYFWNKMAN